MSSGISKIAIMFLCKEKLLKITIPENTVSIYTILVLLMAFRNVLICTCVTNVHVCMATNNIPSWSK